MSLYFEFECSTCELQGGQLSRYAGDRWDAGLVSTMKFFIHHLRTCDTTGFWVRCDADGDGEYGSRPDLDYIPATTGTFPHSDDWQQVAETEDVKEFDRSWSSRPQGMMDAEASDDG
jgi:hypothetical protein